MITDSLVPVSHTVIKASMMVVRSRVRYRRTTDTAPEDPVKKAGSDSVGLMWGLTFCVSDRPR